MAGRRIARLATAPYAAPAYLARRDSRAGLAADEWIGFEDSLGHLGSARWLEENIAPDRIVHRANSLLALQSAARAGMGVAALPCYLGDPDPALVRAKGYDQNYAINGAPGTLRFAARLEDPKSGRVLEEWTTQPGVQVYSANYSPPPVGIAKGYAVHSAVALEAQGFPNAPNIPAFPSTRLLPGQEYAQVTEYRFSAK